MPGRGAGEKDDGLPGPGAYQLHGSLGTGPRAVLTGRPSDGIDSLGPGPGSYDLSHPHDQGKGITIAGRDQPKLTDNSPGVPMLLDYYLAHMLCFV